MKKYIKKITPYHPKEKLPVNKFIQGGEQLIFQNHKTLLRGILNDLSVKPAHIPGLDDLMLLRYEHYPK